MKEIIYREVEELTLLEDNPRKISVEQMERLKESIDKNPDYFECRPVILSDRTGELVVIAGNQRVKAATAIGLEAVPTILLSGLSEEREKEIIIRDNVNNGEWDEELLAEWDASLLDEWGVDISALSESFSSQVGEENREAKEDDFDEGKDSIPALVSFGDIWKLGEHRLMCGDSTDAGSVALLMDGEKADMVFTDPPYGIGIDGQKKSECKNPKHNRKAHEFRGWDDKRPNKCLFEYILSLQIPTIIFGGNYFADLLPAKRGWIYWSKGQDGLTMSDGELAWTNIDKPLRCVTVNRANLGKTMHPTQKPLKVVEFCLNYAGDKLKIIDFFGGSGSTLIACEQLGRKCYMMELDPHYCDVIIARWEKLTGKKAEKVS